MNIRPLFDRVVIRRSEEEQLSAGGIVIPDNAKEKPARGEVVATGEGRVLDNGDVRGLSVKVGDTVLFNKYAGVEMKIEGKELLVLKEDDILAALEV